jgi:subfamily B ATP-binding cassette protein MsbA
VLLVGVRLVIGERLTSGALLVFIVYLGKMYKPMKDLSKMTDTVSKAAVGFERIAEVMSIESQVSDTRGARPAPPFAGRIEFDRVNFSYIEGHPVLTNIDFAIEAGDSVALVGPTGSGKSTIFALIPRFYDTGTGTVRIDGEDIRRYTLRSLRNQISIVPQDPILLRMPIWQNIAYGMPGATRADIVQAARLANAHQFISRLPNGYDTLVGERGDTLSGGERQRIAIARAIVRDTPILLLDEPSAALDPESEALIFEALGRLMQGKTSITIAHRAATVRRARTIFVIDAGQITERGSHDQLIAGHGWYSKVFAPALAGARRTA